MKKLFLILIGIALLVASAIVQAQIVAPIGVGNLALKFDYIVFTDSYFDSSFNQDDGIYIGIEGYGKIASNIYLGGEIGQGININLAGEDINFVPVEVNIKYAREFEHNFVVDFGGGFSYSYAELTHQIINQEVRNDWLFGGQIFADLGYKISWFFAGINTKYQITQSFKDEGVNLNNFKLGAFIGIIL